MGAWRSDRQSCACRCPRFALLLHRWICRAGCVDFDTQGYGLRRGLAQRPTNLHVQVPKNSATFFIDWFAEQDVWTSTRKVTVCGAAWRSDRQTCACKCPRPALLSSSIGLPSMTCGLRHARLRSAARLGAATDKPARASAQEQRYFFHRLVCRAGCVDFDTQGYGL